MPFEAYRDGELPAVCVITGNPADAFVVLRTPPSRRSGATGALDGVLDAVDVRRPREILLGRVPVDSDQWRRVERVRMNWYLVMIAAFLLLIGAAWAAAPWSVVVAGFSVPLLGYAWWRRFAVRRGLPIPTLTHGGTSVTIDNAHEAFAAAVLASGDDSVL